MKDKTSRSLTDIGIGGEVYCQPHRHLEFTCVIQLGVQKDPTAGKSQRSE